MKKLVILCVSGLFMFMTSAAKKPIIWVLGDSTASIYESSRYPRAGWAQVVQIYFNTDSVEIQNIAMSGRSSKSFADDADGWPKFKNSISSGDYVVIQFAHNDEKTSDAARGTKPGSTFEQYLSLYIDFAKSKGAIPILVTPIQRNSWNSDGKTLKQTHITSDGDYPKAIHDLAKTKGVALVDLTKLTNNYFEKSGMESTTKLFLNLAAGEYKNYPDGSSDNTHLHENGAKAVAQLFVDEIGLQKLSPICTWVKGATGGLSENTSAIHVAGKDIVQPYANGTVQIISSEKVSDFSILTINGQVVNNVGKLLGDNTLSVTSVTGKTLPFGKYIVNYRFLSGEEHCVSVDVQ